MATKKKAKKAKRAKKATKKVAERSGNKATKRPAAKARKAPAKRPARKPAKSVRRLTPVLMVDAIEPCIPFWQGLGFAKTVEVPHEGTVGFAILVKDDIEVMYQTKASVHEDIPALASTPMGATFLFIEVSDLEPVIRATATAPQVFPRRKTFYGMDEIGVREPGGNAITFASPTKG